MKTQTFDDTFDSGADITQHLDLGKAKRPNLTSQRVNVDFPNWMVQSLDREASRVGVTRQSLIKMWLAERLDDSSHTFTSNRG
jgi:hypothetical protein